VDSLLSQVPVIRISPSHGWVPLRLRDLWEYRELLYFLVWRDVKVRYKQTVLGIAWVIIQPVATTLIFTIIFGNLARMPSENLPYSLFALSGLVPWNYFSGAFSRGSVSLVGSAHLISKVYFPRLIIPISSVLGGLVDLVIVMGLVFALMIWFGIQLSLAVLALPLYVLLAIVTALAVSMWLSALNVQYRDVSYLVPFVAQFWLYATPVVYPSSLVPEKWRLFYALNPMVSVVEGFRWTLFGSGDSPGIMLGVSIAVVLGMLISGAFFFKRMEKSFADVV
jgi:homopolymeric O-antigen transport system permease protein